MNRKIAYLKNNWKTLLKFWAKERIGTFIVFGIALIMVIVGIITVTNHKKNAVINDFEYVPTVEANVGAIGEYKSVAKAGNLELFYEGGTGTIQVKNLKSGYVWKGIADEEVFPKLKKINKQWNQYLQSAFKITLNDLDNRDAKPLDVFSNKSVDYIETTYMNNGVSVKYGISEMGVFLTVEYLLEDDCFVVKIPYAEISEESQYIINTIEILPYFGAAGDEIEGYLVYPDGCGALTIYGNKSIRTAAPKVGFYGNYTRKNVSLDEYTDPDVYEQYTASLPIWGVKNNDDAVLAVVTKGIENSGINCYPSGTTTSVPLNHMAFQLYMRNVFDVEMFNVSGDEGVAVTNSLIQRVDAEVLPIDREVKYFMLSGDDANYSGMARKYRDYLIENGELTTSIEEGDTIPLALKFLMGATEEQLISTKYITMTSFEDVVNILEELKTAGINDTNTLLSSWLKDGGSEPKYWPIASQLGGLSGLKKLDKYVEENSGNNVYLRADMLTAYSLNGGFSSTSDVVYNGVNLPVTIFTMNGTWYMLSPEVIYENSMKLLDKLSDCPNIGIGFDYLGRLVYPDYNDKHYSLRKDTVATWKKLFEDVAAQGRPVSTEGMNQYAYNNVEYMTETRLSSFGLAITDYSIPLVQMVVSGMKNYSAKPGNLASDLDIQVLEWIEYDALPYFYLSKADSVLLKNTNYNSLFTSTFDVWKDRVISVYNEFKDNLQCVYGKQMTEHLRVNEDIVKLTYENGIIIYLNYNTEDALTYENVTIPAKGYVVTGGGE